jgi:hypothetical protein
LPFHPISNSVVDCQIPAVLRQKSAAGVSDNSCYATCLLSTCARVCASKNRVWGRGVSIARTDSCNSFATGAAANGHRAAGGSRARRQMSPAHSETPSRLWNREPRPRLGNAALKNIADERVCAAIGPFSSGTSDMALWSPVLLMIVRYSRNGSRGLGVGVNSKSAPWRAGEDSTIRPIPVF